MSVAIVFVIFQGGVIKQCRNLFGVFHYTRIFFGKRFFQFDSQI